MNWKHFGEQMAATIGSISPHQLREAVETYVTWAAQWDGALPADVFFGVWAELKTERQPLELHQGQNQATRLVRFE